MTQKWIDNNTWGCFKHVPMPRLPANCVKCWFCGSVRPPLREGQKLLPIRPRASESPRSLPKKLKPSFTSVAESKSVRAKCSWHECVKTAAPNSKYCSRNCSNKNARSRHKAAKGSAAAE